ncbi:ADP-ribosylglycohydrolase family protein [Paludisphaera soli]|uniref:ADP-ribosylglycohydrolase family protein n=1 Tax=Paludisphaera soli TaxID=2712865 RepID=UPI0013EDCE7A|nr:ADP-ribosylglycohydrolase family protein [Paludisphaera soli]
MPQLSRIDRVRGCLLGLAVGDALGAPLEGLTAQQIKTHYGRVKNYVDGVQAWKRKPYRWRMRGLYSDDTQQALALADVLLECGHADQGRLAAIYVAMAEAKGTFLGVHRGIGRSFRQVLADLQRGVSPRWSGQMKAGIGAAMRIAPVGLFFEDDPDGFFRAVMESSVTTHRDVRSLSGAMAVAHGVRRLVAGEPRDPSLLLWLASDVARDEARMTTEGYGEVVISLEPHARAMSKALAHAETLLETPRERALPALAEEANRHGAEPDCKRPTMGFPPACIPTCLYVLLTTDSFEEAIQEIVNLGGDADTTGAILGALAGAHYGIDEIPSRWLEGLQNREGIENRALALARRSTDGLSIPDLIATEMDLNEKEGTHLARYASLARQGGDRGANPVI